MAGIIKEPSLQTPTLEKNDATATPVAAETPNGFAPMGVSEKTLAALTRVGYHAPSPIQEGLIPAALAGRDCLGNAPTGTGKTAAFLIPIIERIDEKNRATQALILVPTRELAHQIGREFEKLSAGRRIRAAAVVGGESIYRQQALLQGGCQIVVATPGRLIDLMDRQSVDLGKVKIMVLDEADQMLDIGFRPAVERILEAVPAPRQTLLLSATMPKGVRELANTYLDDPVDVRLISDREDATVPSIRQSYVMVHGEHKYPLLVKILERDQPKRAIIFCRTKHGADKLGNTLRDGGFRAEAMHGNLSQSQRNRVLAGFRLGKLNILVATDVVGRGIDVPEITHVLNFDIPEDPEHYVHRIGRTGRMGKDGAAVTFVQPAQAKLLDEIEKSISRNLDAEEVEGVPCPPRPMMNRRPSGGRSSQSQNQSHNARGGRPLPTPSRRNGPAGGPPLGNGLRRRRFGSPQRVG